VTVAPYRISPTLNKHMSAMYFPAHVGIFLHIDETAPR